MLIAGRLPLGSTFDYVPHLRGFTQGRGTASTHPDGYEIANDSVANELLARRLG